MATRAIPRVGVMTGAEADRSFFGHPRGLSTLFFTEMWERFSYYGMRAFLIYYMTATVAAGGLGFGVEYAGNIYGLYTGSAWGASILGGIIADRWLGQYRSVLIGGIIIALGHFTLAFKPLPFFYSGLIFIVLGTGLLKPNVSTLVGALYRPGDARRDAGFSIFYMGINLGALFGPLIAGYLAQKVDWHIGFACAGVGMTAGLIQYVVGRHRLRAPASEVPASAGTPGDETTAGQQPAHGFTTTEWKRMASIVIFFLVAILFWGAYEQAGSTLALFADRYTRLEVFGFSFPSSWFQSVQPIFVITLAPIFAWVWIRLGDRDPSVPAKLALGVLFMGLAFAVLVPAGAMAQQGAGVRVSPWWLVISYGISELGELCLYPVGLSAVTKLSPARILGLMMGVWLLSNAFGNMLAGSSARFFVSMPLQQYFGVVAIILFVTAAIMFALVRPIRRLMGGVR
ncbi:MAG TPA: peptide MFS transporter [Vicinamibacterales bacterium]|jgi:POT family proton-dependent oligopeptide transporter|nr:peptide MFS transporter [Vicinamibacterales bacterium]